MPQQLPDAPDSRFRVLIVEDNPINQQVFGMILDAGGFAHTAVDNGRLGLEAAMSGDFDLVLMDIQMPVMDGLEATRLLRAWERAQQRARLPLYIVSANCMPQDVAAGAMAGADGHFAKPVPVAQLLDTVRRHAAQVQSLAA